MKNSDIATLDASNWTYEFEKAEIKNVEQGDLLDFVQEKAKSKIPSNLEFIDNDYNKATGTSGTAFLDKNTGEVIIAYTGTNKDGNAVQDIIGADLGGIGMGFGEHYQPAFDFYEKICGQYGDNITLTGHSLGGNVAQRVALEYNVDNTVVYNSAPLYVNQTYGIKERLYDRGHRQRVMLRELINNGKLSLVR
ncbi:Mbeg1-like protein [Streptococcus pluranimalium]|uniref:Mbeg1-like protein n=1 Tax=Streptococcus pluranimalium TaxID=82348 RepID=UPI003BF8D889